MTAPLTNIIAAAATQQGTQTVEKDEIWSTILTGVASSKMVPTKKILVLGKLN
jgi:dynein light intermediate chain 1